jgi:hypothetical protein
MQTKTTDHATTFLTLDYPFMYVSNHITTIIRNGEQRFLAAIKKQQAMFRLLLLSTD